MPLIELTESPRITGMGSTTPHADPRKFRSAWACVEGENDGRWPSLREVQSTGIAVGNDGRKSLRMEEFTYADGKDKGKPHDITVGKTRLREVICPIDDARAKESYEGALSTNALKNFHKAQEQKSEAVHGSTELTGSLETHQ